MQLWRQEGRRRREGALLTIHSVLMVGKGWRGEGAMPREGGRKERRGAKCRGGREAKFVKH